MNSGYSIIVLSLACLHRFNKYAYFSDLLQDLADKARLDTRQLSILIHIDFFSEFGNQRELEKIVSCWEYFKRGAAKQVRKDQVAGTMLDEIVARHSTDRKKDGTEAASYTITDVRAVIRECEQKVLSLGLSDFGAIVKAKYFNEAMGYNGYISGKEEERAILFVKDVYPVKRKRDGKQFGYSVLTQSIGSGIEGRFTVFNSEYNLSPIKKGDVIKCLRYRRDGKGYFTLEQYRHLTTDDDSSEENK